MEPEIFHSGQQKQEARLALVNGQIVLPERIAAGMAVVITKPEQTAAFISAVTSEEQLPAEIERLDVGGRWISPGLIDIHTHGALGHTFNEASHQAYDAILGENLKRGVTGVVATIATAPIEDIFKSLAFTRAWMAAEQSGAQVLGAHLESPYISPLQSGALDPGNLRSPQDGSTEGLLEYADVLRIMVLAPELPGAIELVARLAQCGIIPAAGHSMAREGDVMLAIQAGLRHVTHLFSAMSSTVREGPWRKPGLLETALITPGLSVEMIADNKHLPPTLMKLAYRCIGPEHLCVISDATSGAGLPDGTRFRMGKMEYEVAEGVGMMFDRSAFAGSTTLLNQMIPILTQEVGIPLPEAIRMTSLNPARLLGLAQHKGSLEVGKDADLVIFNPDFSAWRVMIAGRWVAG
jgi:N-acetylglucosamine-6-phosphate deacetylase